ncbi:hypothetical protein BKP64_05690 [Marinobacter salinus]|uniref:PD-(D/E)XK nuclease superfamily protein n=1 Tax=Marinobacter salinus TaxID=1874317 RepID=A0A1D9GJA2_9GAMM|nr:PD-(D/E)XK nuclease family protein [Marinobacter salinus]AOY87703.1 hypothetical protein BKP64_05690 [Marinobacter salinus]
MSKLNIASNKAEFTDRFRRLADLVETSKESANRHGERFNIFSILGVQRDENRTHSRYLAELLSPSGRHGEGSQFLNAFVKDVLGLSLDVSGPIKVTRELATEDRRRVDIVVESTDLIIGVEVKIDAGDQKAQLHDYFTEISQRAKNRKTVVLAYLTLDGKAPSGYSLRGLEQENVHCLSFAEDIRQWIDRCAALCEHKPELSYALIQYKRLLESLTGAGTSMTSLIADKLAHNRGDLETALAVEKALPRAKSAVMLRFWEELSSAMANALGAAPVVYGDKTLRELSHNYFNGRGGKHVGIKHPIGELNGEKLCLYVNIYHAIHYGLRVDSPSGSTVSRPDIKDKLREKLNDGNAVANKEADWLVCYYYDPYPSHEPAVLNFHSFDGAVLDLLEDENRQAVINNMVEHQVRLVDEARALIETSTA